MKKTTFIFILFLLVFIIVGCTNKDETNLKLAELTEKISVLEEKLSTLDEAYKATELELEAAINDLEAELGQTINDLETEYNAAFSGIEANFDDLDPIHADYAARIAYLEAQRNQLLLQITNLENELAAIGVLGQEVVNVFLEDEYYLVADDNFQLFYRSVIQSVNPYYYHIKLTGNVGHNYNRYYEWKPTTADVGKTYLLKLDVRDNNNNTLGTASTKLIVSKADGTLPAKNVLCIGDSLTSSGVWVKQGYDLYAAAGGSPINLLGTVTSSGVKHEGHGGWQWSSYVSGYGSTPSPFKAKSGVGISFLDYCSTNGYSHIDELYVLMTYNGVGGSFRTFSMESEPFKSAKILIDQFHKDFPNAKITLLGIPLPSLHAGLGDYYTIGQSYGDNYGQFVTVLNYNRQLSNFAKDPAYSAFMRFVDVGGQFDSEYNMPTVPKQVNNQNTITELIGSSMGLHPSNNGYKQIGDVFYRALCKKWA